MNEADEQTITPLDRRSDCERKPHPDEDWGRVLKGDATPGRELAIAASSEREPSTAISYPKAGAGKVPIRFGRPGYTR